MPDIILDDRDSSINYVGQWAQGGLQGSEYQATTMHCTAPASGTSATLSFVGTGVAVYGTVVDNDVQASSYKVDDSNPVSFESSNSSATRFSQQFFSIPGGSLPNASHTLVITPVQGTLSLDFMTVHILSLSSNAPSQPPPHNNNTGLIVGVAVGVLGLMPVSGGGTYTYGIVDSTVATSIQGGYPSERVAMGKAREAVLLAPPEYTSGVATS
ncbi:hypothetical protein BDN70DRAFT_982458 [Pholiota conissans]|uniref:Uncharacterized protein n=1 Tax=Pholiota conissans TaxID=109636 RepID=A0A9P5YN35_9AGAR|nr:hypothetical protein BDN70DRAFT_982458 [Pholiota conissans]